MKLKCYGCGKVQYIVLKGDDKYFCSTCNATWSNDGRRKWITAPDGQVSMIRYHTPPSPKVELKQEMVQLLV